jgi:hypothetical protein
VAHTILSATHTDTVAAAVVRGDVIVGGATGPAWKRLAKGADGYVLASNATDVAWVSPVIAVADEVAETTCYIGFYTAAVGYLPGKTNANLTFDASTGIVTAAGFTGPSTMMAVTSPTNLVRNGGAENGTTYWAAINDVGSDGAISAYAADFYCGSASLRFVRTVKGGWGSIFYNQISNYLPSPYFNTSLQYTINFWAKSLSGASGTLGTMISDTDGTDVVANFGNLTIPTAWTRFSFTFTPLLAGATPVLYFGPVEDAIDVLIDNVQLNVGTQAMGYCGLQMDCDENAFIAGDLDVRGDYSLFGTAQGYSYFYENTLNFGYVQDANFGGLINYVGYLGGITQFRDLTIYDGKQNAIAFFDGSTGNFGVGVTPICRVHAKSSGTIFALETTVARGSGDGYMAFYDPTGRKGYFGYGGPTDDLYLVNEMAASVSLGTSGSTRVTIDASGNVGIGTTTIPRGGVGAAKFAMDGTNASTAGPHVQYTTAADDYPLFQQLNWAHDDISILFDAYFDGASVLSSDAGSNFALVKFGDIFKIQYDTGIAQGGAVTFNDAFLLDATNATLTLGNTTGAFSTVLRTGSGAMTFTAGGVWDVNATGDATINGANIGLTTDGALTLSISSASTWATGGVGWTYDALAMGEDLVIGTGGGDVLKLDYLGGALFTPPAGQDVKITQEGPVTDDADSLELTNTGNAAAMTDTRTSIRWNQWYYDAATPAVADAAKITVGTLGNWTSVDNTRSSYLSLNTALRGVLTEGLRVEGHSVTVSGSFGCNSAAAQPSYGSGGALAGYVTGAFGLDSDANMQAMYDLVVAVREALVANGIMS